jgi:hypothetical protein
VILGTVAATAVLWVSSVAAPAGQTSQTQRSPMAEDVFKNVQVLRGIPVDAFMGTMGFFSASTGLNCTDCHVEESGGDWARYADDNDLKRTTRRMYLMMTALNRANFGGRQVVTCNTCHRGTSRPNVMPSLVALYGSPPPDEPGEPFEQADGQPTADQVLDKYIEALGGAQRVASFTSFTAKGTYIGFDDADKSPVDIAARAPNQRSIVIHTRSGDNTTNFDGISGWNAAPATDKPVPILTLTGQELDGVRIETEVFFPSRIKVALRDWRVGFPAVIDDREVQPVQGTTAGGATVTLCFDRETGLLVRLVRYSESPVGRLVSQVDYADHREVAGVKLPFRWKVTWLSGRSTFELASVQPNVVIDSARFARPAPSALPAAEKAARERASFIRSP